jgi:hypothetical protein
MSWQEGVGIVLVVLGLLGGLIIAGQRPSFWVEFVGRAFIALRPVIWKYVSKPMDKDTEQEWRDCIRRGGEWDHMRKRCKR